jgi:hypothetical protein
VLIAGELTEQVIGLVAIPVIYKAMPIGDRSRADIVVVARSSLRSNRLPPSCRPMKRNCTRVVAGLDPAIGLVSNCLSSSIRPRKREEH